MQNLQIRYPSSSPQVQYLSSWNLIEEEEIDRRSERDTFELVEEDFVFEERDIEQDDDEQHLEFSEFVRQVMGTGTCLKGIEIVEKLEAIFLVLFGEIFELSYHCRMLDPRHKNSRIRVIQQYKWTIVIHLFLVFLSVIVWPIQTIVIFCLISQLLTTENHPSQLEKSETLPKLLVQSNQRLKFFCVSHQKQITRNKQIIEKLLNDLFSSIQTIFDVKLKRSLSIFDDFDEVIYRVNKAHKEKFGTEEFMNSKGWFSIKNNYWKIIIQNKKIQKSIKMIDQTIETIETNLSGSAKFTKKIGNHSDLYYLILSNKLKELQVKEVPSQHEKIQMSKLLKILEKEICLKKIMSNNQTFSRQEEQVIYSQKQQQENIEIFVDKNKRTDQPIVYKDGSMEQYASEEFGVISSRLENILKERERKQQEQKRQKEQKIRQDSSETSMKSTKLERRTFGIPLIPPARDMSAFYVQ